MSRNLSAMVEGFACAAFAASTLAASLLMRVKPPPPPPITLDNPYGLFDPWPEEAARHLVSIVSQPVNPALWSLLIGALLAAVAHLALRVRCRFVPPLRWTVSLGFLTAAAWPWVIDMSPLLGLVLAAGATALLIQGLILDLGRVEHMLELTPLGLVAGWQLVAAAGTAALALHALLGLGLDRATLLALLGMSLAGARVQMMIGPNISFSLALIWAMIGIAAASLGISITLATACVLGIASLAVVIVRVTT
ncbi:MAG TPA: hypothetical protein PLL33_06030 [Paracoccus sp. (in: a-proteobacteria)]|nr:hypothetical protein [Paracoccus sp. (in: a-proteobacteria)]